MKSILARVGISALISSLGAIGLMRTIWTGYTYFCVGYVTLMVPLLGKTPVDWVRYLVRVVF